MQGFLLDCHPDPVANEMSSGSRPTRRRGTGTTSALADVPRRQPGRRGRARRARGRADPAPAARPPSHRAPARAGRRTEPRARGPGRHAVELPPPGPFCGRLRGPPGLRPLRRRPSSLAPGAPLRGPVPVRAGSLGRPHDRARRRAVGLDYDPPTLKRAELTGEPATPSGRVPRSRRCAVSAPTSPTARSSTGHRRGAAGRLRAVRRARRRHARARGPPGRGPPVRGDRRLRSGLLRDRAPARARVAAPAARLGRRGAADRFSRTEEPTLWAFADT